MLGLWAFMNGGNAAQTPNVQDVTDPLASVIGTTGDLPIVSIRFNTDGTIEEATGDDSAPLVYSEVGNWLDSTPDDGNDWELLFDVQTEDVGDPGTWSGSTRGSYIALGTQRTFTWTKDGTDTGTAESVVDLTVREVADTGNSDFYSGVNNQVTITA